MIQSPAEMLSASGCCTLGIKGNPSKLSSNFAVDLKATPVDRVGKDNLRATRKCYFCQGQHDLDDCSDFLNKEIEQKRDFLKSKNCATLVMDSTTRQMVVCGNVPAESGNKRHPKALHVDNFIPNKVTSYSSANQDTSVATTQSETSHVI